MQAKFTVLGGPNDGLVASVSHLPITLGREGDRALPISDRWASRFHCQIAQRNGRLMVRDLASKHGTYVNGERIQQCTLEVGDKLMVGLTHFVVSEISPTGNELGEVAQDHPSGAGV